MTGAKRFAWSLGDQWLKLTLALLAGLLLLLGTLSAAGAADSNVPMMTVIAVEAGTSVTVRTANFPANRVFNVLFGPMGTQGVNGTYVGNFDSGPGGELVVRMAIPPAFAGDDRIAIRVESGGYYSYNWFHNADFDAAAAASAEEAVAPPPAPSEEESGSSSTEGSGFYIEVSLPAEDGGEALSAPEPASEPSTESTPAPAADSAEPTEPLTPTITFLAVTQGVSVTIATENFPPSRTFTATMSRTVTLGLNGVEVGTLDSGAGGSVTATFPIPAELAKEYAIAIRLESADGWFSYAWFYNQNYLQQPAK